MIMERASIEAEFARRLLPLARRWRAVADHAVAGLGLSNATGWVLLHVGRLGDAVRQSELADALDMQGGSLVRLIDQLEQASLLERRVDERDRRANRVSLTPEGRRLVGRIEEALGAIRKEMFAGIDGGDLAVATDVLTLLDRRIIAQRAAAR
jgi:MarR family transcriptional regulator for hemolysin